MPTSNRRILVLQLNFLMWFQLPTSNLGYIRSITRLLCRYQDRGPGIWLNE